MEWSRTLSLILLSVMFGLATSDINQDKTECADQLVGLAPCLPYVGGQAKTPTIDCCGGLKQVLDKSKKCLCVLIKDRNDPDLGLTINASLAVTLPNTCNAPVNMTDCITLLHLTPHSQEAKLFEGYQKLTEGRSGTPPAATVSSNSTSSAAAADKSGGQTARRPVGVEMAVGISLWVFAMYRNVGV